MYRNLALFSAGAIFAIGLVMIFSTTSAEILENDLDKHASVELFKQLFYACLGGGLAIGVCYIGHRKFILLAPILLIIFSFLLLLTLFPGIGREVNGSKRWLNLGGFSFQPSEFVKVILPSYLIYQITQFGVKNFWSFIKMLLPASIPLFLILIEPNNGTVAVIVMASMVVIFLAGISMKYWALPLLVLILIGGTFASQLPYVQGRLKVYLNPELDILGKGHQPHQAKIAAGSGRLFGKGPGNSWQKLSYLPEAQNDYIAAIYAEEFGYLGILSLLALYLLFALSGFYIAFEAKSPQGYYLAAVVTFLISFQAFLNFGVVSGLLPSTGLNLPLFSQGGSSLIANMLSLALLLDIGRSQLCEP